jgi:hypothetical protein
MTRTGKGVGKFWTGSVDAAAENLRGCLASLERTRLALASARDALHAHGPGTTERNAAHYNMHKLHAEVLGWTQAAKEWQEELDDLRQRAVEAAAKAQQVFELEQRRAAALLALMPTPPVVEHPGADDDGDAWEPEPDQDDERESPYAELGGAVGGAR